MNKIFLFLLLISISFSCSASLFSWFTGCNDSYSYYKIEDVVHYEHACNANGVLEIENPGGSIAITGSDEKKIVVLAKKRATTPHALQKVIIHADLHEKKSKISTEISGGLFKGITKAIVDYTILIPKTAHLVVSSGAGSITVQDIHGSVRVSSGAGSTNLRNVSGCLTVEGGSGTIAIACAHEGKTTITAKSGAGTIAIENATGSVEASTTTGTLSIEHAHLMSDTVINAQTVVGSIALQLPHDLHANVIIATNMGAIHSDFPILESPQTQRGWLSKKIDGNIGNGGSHILLQTNLGNITLRSSVH
jgi:DUF4097 and DUF4098 domain-containing protein YvlB